MIRIHREIATGPSMYDSCRRSLNKMDFSLFPYIYLRYVEAVPRVETNKKLHFDQDGPFPIGLTRKWIQCSHRSWIRYT